MLGFGSGADAKAILEAVGRSQAIIEFTLDGAILGANDNFCRVLGYPLAEIVGRKHRIFVDKAEAETPEYQAFWTRLGRGEFSQGQYRRITRDGREIWIEASYNPVFIGGRFSKVVKLATDITANKLKAAEDSGKIDAIGRVQAIIEFTPKGEILTANGNFLDALGYQLAEIQGRHHSMFCESAYAASEGYRGLWRRLAAGEFVADEFVRIGKGGRKVAIQASYNPIFDMNGRVFKVVKFATDVTARVNNVDALAGGLKALAEGDLTQTIEKPFLPAFETLRVDFNGATERLRAAMQTVSQNAGAIAMASQDIQTASDDLARRTEQQASSVEETAAALEEITTTMADSSRRAQEAGELVRNARESAERSGVIVDNAVEAMGRIESSATEIGSIIGVIDEIAFQTNLLALNAGVEAARAGEAGKGFAVVAQEVRELAQRSARAAREIKELISASNGHVKNGVSLVGETGGVLRDIAAQVMQVNDNVNAIVEAAREQAAGLRAISEAINTMDQATQRNATMVEESKASAHGLANEARSLFQLISQFEIGGRAEGLRVVARSTPTPVLAARPSARSTAPSPLARKADWQEF